ncbi:MAG TPA: hypothetical protein VFS19_05625 [Planctomycetota bacterium]|nr:hypothetical protein [Planctomycetota bacterium]
MTRLRFAVLALAGWGLLTGAQQQSPAPAASKSILWSRTWDGALREAKIRNVPIYILVSIGEG